MQQRLRDLGERFQEMEIAQMKKGEIAARQKLEAANSAIAEKRAEFERQLDRARKVSDEAWDEVSDALRTAWTEMKEAVEHARRDFAGELEAETQEASTS